MGKLVQLLGATLLATLAFALPDAPKSRRATRIYDFTVAPGTYNPDGTLKHGILVNGQWPGPTITADLGDTIQVTVRNKLTEGTLIHWHGFDQRGTPWYDGTPASETCPIAPNDAFTYTFTADKLGSSWYHSHYSAQHADGLKGPMVIRGASSAPYDIDLGPVFLSDNYHQSYQDNVRMVNMPTMGDARADSNLINGKGQDHCDLGVNCPSNAPYSTFNFTSKKTHLLRLVNANADATQCFRIDGHSLNVIAVDFVPVTPYTVPGVSLTSGQRMDVLVTAHSSPRDSYWMRSDLSFAEGPNDSAAPPNLKTKAAIYYESANRNALPSSQEDTTGLAQCGHDPLAELHPTRQEAAFTPATTKTITVDIQSNSSGYQDFYMNNRTFRANYNYPILLLAKAGNTTNYPAIWNVYDFGTNQTVRVIFYNRNPQLHPMHLHGHDFQVLAQGVGTWNGTITNPTNPARRDVTNLPAGLDDGTPGYLVMQWHANNPGVWGLHCHIAWHSSTGLFINILEQPKSIAGLSISDAASQSLKDRCRNWWQYTNHTVVDQIDSGL